MKYIFLLILVLSCSSKPTGPTQSEIYFDNWKADYYTDDVNYQNSYKKYLYQVEEIFNDYSMAPKFEPYLNSVTNFYQLMANAEFNIESLYKRIKGHRISLKTQAYDQFRNKNLSDQFRKLHSEHIDKMKSILGESFLNRLKTHYGKANQPFPPFPL